MAKCIRIPHFLLAFVLGITAFIAAAQANSPTAALTEAAKLMEQGVPVKAIELINKTLASGQIPEDLAAKALLMRAQAQEKIGKQAYALADYNQALWMQGLSAADKSRAEAGRDRILGKLGVNTQTADAASAAKKAAGPPQLSSWDTDVQTSPSEERTGGIGSIFSGIFGTSKRAEAKPQPEPSQPAAAVAAQPARTERVRPQPVNSRQAQRSVASVDAQADDTEASRGEVAGNFAIQFAALYAEDKAIYEVERVGKRYGPDLAGRTPSLKILGTSDGGTLYKVIAAPYGRGEGTAICELLKTKGVACMLISN